MKKTLFFLTCLSLFILLTGCSSPPTLTVTADKKKIDTVTGSYCWSSLFSEKCVDTIEPSELLKKKKNDPVGLHKATTLNFKFEEEPQTVEVRIEQSNASSTSASVKLEDNQLTLPQENGTYLYIVFSKHAKGTVTHLFTINVE
ncbi:hypothetical protein PV433_14255 [Paenibacillus sp. GYB004]|uniref:hypothetical protein n=1 Tax=Paenibacillus sp. GYB004 TaxID=2994393 RepID=UPI002F96590E